MPAAQVADDLDMHYVADDFTDPWRTPETILLLHGNAESGAMWFGWVPHLARHFRVVRPDMRGFGASTPMPMPHSTMAGRLGSDFLPQGLAWWANNLMGRTAKSTALGFIID